MMHVHWVSQEGDANKIEILIKALQSFNQTPVEQMGSMENVCNSLRIDGPDRVKLLANVPAPGDLYAVSKTDLHGWGIGDRCILKLANYLKQFDIVMLD